MDHITKHLMKIYGIDDGIPLALQFPRLPPGIGNLPHMLAPRSFAPAIQGLPPREGLDDYTRLLQKNFSGLLDMTYPGLIPPGHPLYNKQVSIESLQTENSKLKKENADLKRHLSDVSSDKRSDETG